MNDELMASRSLLDDLEYRDSLNTEIIAAQTVQIENLKSINYATSQALDDVSATLDECDKAFKRADRLREINHTLLVIMIACVPAAYGLGSLVEQLK